MVLLHNSISQKHSPEQLSSMISCRESDVHYKEICKKHLHSNYVQMLWVSHNPWSGKSSVHFQSLFLWWCATSSWHVVRHCRFCQGQQNKSQEAGTALNSNMLGTMHWSYNAQKVFCRRFFLESLVCIFWARFITQELAFSFSLWHGDLK